MHLQILLDNLVDNLDIEYVKRVKVLMFNSGVKD